MVALLWDQIGQRTYETGVSRGVLYVGDNPGVAWNGLISIEDGYDDSVDPVHFDGQKINDILVPGDWNGTLTAFTYPEEFNQCVGQLEDEAGFFVTGQAHSRFGLVWRTEVSTDTDREAGYKIHAVYNITAVANPRDSRTLTLDPEATEFSWELTSIPERVEGFKATSHFIFDSRQIDPFMMADVEDIFYGTADSEPRLPAMRDLATFMQRWGRLVITDNGDGTWTAYSPLPGVITGVTADQFTITSDTITMLDADTYTIESDEVEGP